MYKDALLPLIVLRPCIQIVRDSVRLNIVFTIATPRVDRAIVRVVLDRSANYGDL